MTVKVTPVRSTENSLEQVSRDWHDYLTGQGEAPGRCGDTWTQLLSIIREVTGDQFEAMFEEWHPATPLGDQ